MYDCEDAGQADEDFMRYNDSVSLTTAYGFGAARMSISWPRVMAYAFDATTGELTWERNEEGIAHYHSVLAAYQAAGVKPAITMWHWDLPLAIEEKAATMDCGSAWLCFDLVSAEAESYAVLLFSEVTNDS